MSPYRSSRLTRNYRKNNKNLVIFSIIGIIGILAIFLYTFPYILSGIGSLSGGSTTNEDTDEISTVLLPPRLDQLPRATDSAYMTISGSTLSDGTVEVFVNDSVVERISTEDGTFTTELVKLDEGTNTIKALLRSNNSKSGYSENFEVEVIKDEPSLEVSFPNNNDSFVKADKRITIRGKTDPNNSVRINGFRAVVGPDGQFSYVYDLKDGQNELKIEASNAVGKTTEQTITVSYSQE